MSGSVVVWAWWNWHWVLIVVVCLHVWSHCGYAINILRRSSHLGLFFSFVKFHSFCLMYFGTCWTVLLLWCCSCQCLVGWQRGHPTFNNSQTSFFWIRHSVDNCWKLAGEATIKSDCCCCWLLGQVLNLSTAPLANDPFSLCPLSSIPIWLWVYTKTDS